MNEIQQNVNTADQTKALIDQARNKAVSDYLGAMNNPTPAPTFTGERPTFVASAKQSVHDWTDNSGIPFVAQINPYAAAGMGFANQMANPFKQRYFEERADANEAEDARRLNYELQKDKYDDDYRKFRDKLNDSRYDKEDLYSKYADALRGIEHDKDFEYRKSRDTVGDKQFDKKLQLEKDRINREIKEKLELKAKDAEKDKRDIFAQANAIKLIDEDILDIAPHLKDVISNYNNAANLFKQEALRGNMSRAEADLKLMKLQDLHNTVRETRRKNPGTPFVVDMDGIDIGNRSWLPFSEHNKYMRVRTPNKGPGRNTPEQERYDKSLRQAFRDKQEELAKTSNMQNLSAKQTNQIIAKNPVLAKAVEKINKQYGNPIIRFAVTPSSDGSRLTAIIQDRRNGQIEVKDIPEMLPELFKGNVDEDFNIVTGFTPNG